MRDELRSLGEQMGVKDGASCFNTTFAGFVPVTLDHSFGASVAMCFDPKENPAKGGVKVGSGQGATGLPPCDGLASFGSTTVWAG
jgi:hypothetical protein